MKSQSRVSYLFSTDQAKNLNYKLPGIMFNVIWQHTREVYTESMNFIKNLSTEKVFSKSLTFNLLADFIGQFKIECDYLEIERVTVLSKFLLELCLELITPHYRTVVEWIVDNQFLDTVAFLIDQKRIVDKRLSHLVVSLAKKMIPSSGSAVMFKKISDYLIDQGLVDFIWSTMLVNLHKQNLQYSACLNFFVTIANLNSRYLLAYVVRCFINFQGGYV